MNGVKLDNNCNEVSKLQQHLTLLKEEYVKLQTLYNEIDRKYALLSATSGNITDNTYVSRLVKVVSGLYDNPLYSDLNIQLPNRNVSAHKLVLTARSNNWGKINLSEVDSLDWTNYGSDIGLALLKWVYTDQVDFSKGEDFTLELIKIANVYELYDLIAKCEKALMALVNVRNCVRFYSTADEIGAETLKQHCSSLISTHWEDFTSEDFSHMSAPLLFHMFKNKTQFPLHSAIRLQREDVVFLYLVENNSQILFLMGIQYQRFSVKARLHLETCSVDNVVNKDVTRHEATENFVRHQFLVPTSCRFLLKKMSNDILISKRVDSSERH